MRKLANAASAESLERRTSHLEALHRVGVALAGSFNIDSILSQIATVAGELVGPAPIDVFYAGSRAINSKAKWYSSPSPNDLSDKSRQQLAKEVAQLFSEGATDPLSFVTHLESLLHELSDGASRHLVPISQNDEFLGTMIVKARFLDKEDRDLLSILCLQAATALANIHLTQERIHAERLSAFGQMIGSLVHDFRSPLTAVRGYIGMLGQADLQAFEQERFSQLAVEECDRLNSMIDELLEFTRGGQASLELQSISIADFLQDLMPTIKTHFQDRLVNVALELGYDGLIHIDPGRMKRAILNVASNASQAMSGDGEFVIRSSLAGNGVTIELHDTGCGIPEEIRHRIFEPFFSYGKPQGIGLGMAITRKIIEEHGGEVEIASEVGKGTTVRFVLPLGQEEAVSSQQSAASEDHQ
jgi:signal transduction histidine kinase